MSPRKRKDINTEEEKSSKNLLEDILGLTDDDDEFTPVKSSNRGAKGKGLVNGDGLRSVLGRKGQGLINGDGLVNGRGGKGRKGRKGKGLTNGDGLVNGRGSEKRRGRRGRGLTNGEGLVNGNGRKGLVNGLINGNGLTNGVGRVNGLINGNGLTNGVGKVNGFGLINGTFRASGRNILKNRSKPVLKVAFILLVFLIPTLLFFYYIDDAEYVKIDGKFGDWDGVFIYDDASPSGNPNIDIISYGVTEEPVGTSFYVRVEGNMFAGRETDTEYNSDIVNIYLDVDGDASTGYIFKDIGADQLIRVQGHSQDVDTAHIYQFSKGYKTNSTRTRDDWNGWSPEWTVPARSYRGELEVQASLDEGFVKGYVQVIDHAGAEDVSDSFISLNLGNLVVESIPLVASNNPLMSTEEDVMKLRLNAFRRDVTVTGVTFNARNASVAAPGGFPMSIPQGESRMVTVRASASGAPSGTFIGIDVASVQVEGTATSVTLNGSGVRTYAYNVPSAITIDGAFGDWLSNPKVVFQIDSDEDSKVENANVDLVRYGAYADDDLFAVYARMDGTIFGGTVSPGPGAAIPKPPFDNDRDGRDDTDGDGLENGFGTYDNDFDNDGIPDATDPDDDNDDVPDTEDDFLGTIYRPYSMPGPSGDGYLPPLIAKDSTMILIDTDNDLSTGFRVDKWSLGADILVEVSGRMNRINSATYHWYTGETWMHMGTVDAANDANELEIGFDMAGLGITGDFSFIIRTQDVLGNKDESQSRLDGEYTPPVTRGFNMTVGSVDPWAITLQGDTYHSSDALSWSYKGNPNYGDQYVDIAAGSGTTAGYIYLLLNNGTVFFTDRGTNGWNEYGYGTPACPENTSYVAIACGKGNTAGYVYILRSDGKVYFTDRGTNGWNQYGYGAPVTPKSSAYVSMASGSSGATGYIYILRNDGNVYFTDRGTNGWNQYGYGSPSIPTSTAYIGLAVGSDTNAGYVYVLRRNGDVYFTDRGTNGWNEYGYGTPSKPTSSAYLDIACGSTTTSGYVYLLRSNGNVQFTDRGTNGWNQYGYGTPAIPASLSYRGITAEAGYVYVHDTKGQVYFTDRGTNGWNQYGYGTPSIVNENAYTAVTGYKDGGTVWALRQNGEVYKSTDNGVTWSSFGDAGNSRAWESLTSTHSYIYALKADGTVMRSGVSTASWTTWGDAGGDISWIGISSDDGGYLYAIRRDGVVSYATESSSTWNSKGDAGDDYSWVDIGSLENSGTDYVYAMRNDRSVYRALTGTSISWNNWASAGDDTSWVAIAVGGGTVLTLRNDGTIDKADTSATPTWSTNYADVGTDNAFVDLAVAIPELGWFYLPGILILLTFIILNRVRKRKHRSLDKGEEQ